MEFTAGPWTHRSLIGWTLWSLFNSTSFLLFLMVSVEPEANVWLILSQRSRAPCPFVGSSADGPDLNVLQNSTTQRFCRDFTAVEAAERKAISTTKFTPHHFKSTINSTSSSEERLQEEEDVKLMLSQSQETFTERPALETWWSRDFNPELSFLLPLKSF